MEAAITTPTAGVVERVVAGPAAGVDAGDLILVLRATD